jgi:hypothetical protein
MNFFLRRSAPIFLMICLGLVFISAQKVRAQEVIPDEGNLLLTAPPEKVLRIYIAKNEEYNERIQEIIKENIKTISHSCRKVDNIRRIDPEIYGTPPVFPKKHLRVDPPMHPIKGQWKDRFVISGCDREYIFNFLASALEYSPPYMLPLVNGNSRIDPIYQLTAEEKAYRYIEAIEPQICTSGGLKMVYDTAFIGYIQEDKSLSANNANRGWFEKWQVWVCHELKEVTVAVDQQANQVFNVLVRYTP